MVHPAGRVLVVDDELGVREGCRRALIGHGFVVDLAENGPTGLRKLREGRFDVLLLDAMIPGMSGLEVLRQARQIDSTLVCIVITGYATVELAVQAIQEGAYDFVAKPFTAEHLRQVIGRGLERRHLQREAERVRVLEDETREIARARDELERLAAVEGRFMLTMVHTVRAPVGVLQSSLQLVRKGYVPPDEQPAFLERAEQRAGELLAILDDLLLLAYLKQGIGAIRTEKTSLADILQDVVAALRVQAEKQGVAVSLEVADRPCVTANPDHITALGNQLLSNAIRYTPREGRVTVSLQTRQEQRQAIIAVSDTGIGIAVADTPRVFEEFYRTESAKAMQETGTGLGLPIVQQVVEMYGGTIEVESAVGQGSTFRCVLPVADGREA